MSEDVEIGFGGKWDDLHSTMDEVSSYIHGWGRTLEATAVGGVAAGLIERLVENFGELVSEGGKAIDVMTNLTTTLDASGDACGFTADELKNLAEEMQKTTKFSDTMILKAETLAAAFKNVRGDEFEKTIRLAADMGQRMGGDVASNAYVLAKALDAPVQGMMMLRRQGIRFTEEQEALVKSMVDSNNILGAQKILLDKLQEQFGGAATAAGAAAGGGFARLENVLSSLYENFGVTLVKVLDPFTRLLATAAERVNDFLSAFNDTDVEIVNDVLTNISTTLTGKLTAALDYFGTTWDAVWGGVEDSVSTAWDFLQGFFDFTMDIVSEVCGWLVDQFKAAWDSFDQIMQDFDSTATDALSNIWEGFKEVFVNILRFGVAVITAIEVAFQKMPTTLDIAWVSMQLGAIGAFENIKYFLTVEIPAYLKWFSENWIAVFTDLYTFVGTVISNMYDNMVMFFKNIWAWLNGDDTDWQWKSLTDGFKATMKELPEIADRELTQLEKDLTNRLGDDMMDWGTKFNEQYHKHLKELGIDPDNPGFARNQGDADANADGKKKPPRKGPGERENYARDEDKGAQFEDLEALFKRIQQSTASLTPDQQRAQKHLETTEEVRDNTKRGADAAEKSAAALEKAITMGTKVAVLGK